MKRVLSAFALVVVSGCVSGPNERTRSAEFDRLIEHAMEGTSSKGLAIALVEDGHVRWTKTYGVRNGQGAPLQTDTVMYGASLTKAAFAYMVLQLVDEGKLDLDKSIADYLPQPLPSYNSSADQRAYADWTGLESDPRWRKITPRILLTHSAGFSNFGFLEPDGKLKIHFEPGSRYAYSGDGLILLQFVLARGLGLDVGKEMQTRVFDRFGMTNTSMTWRPDFAANLADGFKADGSIETHDERSRVRAAGSMDTTLADFAKFAAGYTRGEGLSPASRAELAKPQLGIATRSQFPSLQALEAQAPFPFLSSGLGVITFKDASGNGFFKGGHNDSTANMWLCIADGRRCVVLLSNDVRSEAAFPAITKQLLGNTMMPWRWEYGEMQFWMPPTP